MASTQVDPQAAGSASERIRTFGPFLGIVVAAVIALVILPSNFTLPNSSPSPQLAIAPVPPTQNHAITQKSNFTSVTTANQGNGLGLGGNGGNVGDRGRIPPPASVVTPPPPLSQPGPTGTGGTPPVQKDCVAGRQTEDPLTPPCVASYYGNNGGSTYQGVTGKEIKVLVYSDAYMSTGTSASGNYSTPLGTIIDIDNPPTGDKRIPPTTALIAWEKFFNFRYETYNRHVHFYEQFASYDSTTDTETNASQAQDAANAYANVQPFAVIDMSQGLGGGGTGYISYMNQHKVLVFGTAVGLENSLYQTSPGLDYGYNPTTDYGAQQYADFVCTSLANKPVSDVGANSNPPGDPKVVAGGKRVFGFVYTTDPSVPSLQQEAKAALADIKKQCGITPADTETFPLNGYAVDPETLPTYAVQAMAKFQEKGISTVLWPAGFETKFSTAAQSEGYYPEWIMGDDNLQPSTSSAQFQNQAEWAHAWDVTSVTYYPTLQFQICYVEYRQVDQTSDDSDVQSAACPDYNVLRQLFTGIQIAGPDLTPATVNQGFHAIPAKPSTNAQIPSCFYLANDYTCVKDSSIEHWDPNTTQTDNGQPGGWRMYDNGARFLPGKFPGLNLLSMKGKNDVVNQFDNNYYINDAT